MAEAIKSGTGRRRPNGINDRSFPSRHATQAFSYATWFALNLESTDLPDRWHLPTLVLVKSAAIGTGWARVEGGDHFPTDVLLGAALGNFLMRFFHRAFLGLPDEVELSASYEYLNDGFTVGVRWSPR